MDASVKQVAPAADHFCDGFAVAKAKTRKRKYEVVMLGARRFLRSDASKLRQESVNSKYEVPEVAADVACQDSHSCTTSEQNSAELNKCAEEVEVQDKGVVFGVEQHKEDQHSNKDPAEVIAGKKRNIESFSSDPTDKKLKLESSYFSDGVVAKSGGKKKAGRKKIINESSKHNVDEKNASDSESVIPAASPSDGLVDKRKRSIMRRTNSLEYPENETGKGGNDFQEVAGIRQNQNKVLGSGGTSRILRSSIRKLGELGRVLPESGTVPDSLKNDVSAVLTGKDQLKPRKAKRKSGSRSPEAKLKTVDHSVKYEVKVKVGKACSSEVSPESKQSACKTEKQKLRDQIKTILLNAGWKIDLRPRKGKRSFDSVYIPPKGCGLWSITKAYEVYLSRLQPRHDANAELLSKRQSVTSKWRKNSAKGIVIPSPPMSLEAVSMLRRKIFTKRTRKEFEAARKKLKKINGIQGVASRVRRAIKGSKIKHTDINGRNIDKKLEVKDSTSSSTKARLGPSAKKLLAMAGRKKKNKRSGCALLVRGINQEAETSSDDYVPYVWKRTILSWMIDSGVVSANGKIKYMNKRRTRVILEGQITRDGILCSCCNEVVTVSNFECHAGSKVSQPYENIYVEEARMSLLKCQLNAWEKQEESERRGFYSIDVTGDDPNDDTCGICGDGGDLICCDCCPSTFHLSCLKIEMLPPGIWHCSYCSCRFCGLASETTQESNSSVLRIHSCLQCEEKFHQQCIPEADADPSNCGLSCISFCGQTCKKIFESLQSLLGIKHDMEDGFSWSLVQRVDDGSSNSLGELDKRVECNSKVVVALGVMEECFLPIVDQRSGINLIHNVLYNCGSNFNRLNYSGFYTFILEQGDEIISAACVRIHGTRLAEMPFIGTRNMYRRQGMCRRLLNGIEEALRSLNIQKLIIPAISELIHTWTNYFGFKPLDASDKEELKSMNVLVFPGTGLLLKPLLTKDSAPPYGSDIAAGRVELKDKCGQMPEVASSSVPHSSDEVPGGSAKQSLDAETSDVEAIRSDSVISQTCDEVNISLQKDATDSEHASDRVGIVFVCELKSSYSKSLNMEAHQVDSSNITESVAKIGPESDSAMQEDLQSSVSNNL